MDYSMNTSCRADGERRAAKPFVTCIHDVAPENMIHIRSILDALSPLLASKVSAAVVPYTWSVMPGSQARDAIAELLTGVDETVLHGFSHTRAGALSPLSKCLGGADELVGLPKSEIDRRIGEGQQILSSMFGRRSRGFIPPAWRFGSASLGLMAQHGIEFTVGLSCLQGINGSRTRLATWSWDCGVIPGSGRAGEMLGSVLARRREATPCIVLHPLDVPRGFLPRAVERVRSMLDRGYRPSLFDDLYEEAS
jgi:uncharacterized protein